MDFQAQLEPVQDLWWQSDRSTLLYQPLYLAVWQTSQFQRLKSMNLDGDRLLVFDSKCSVDHDAAVLPLIVVRGVVLVRDFTFVLNKCRFQHSVSELL